jgi:hypothetical protein
VRRTAKTDHVLLFGQHGGTCFLISTTWRVLGSRDLFGEEVVPLLLVQDAFLEDDDLRAQLGILSGELLVLEAEVRGRLLGHDGLLLLPLLFYTLKQKMKTLWLGVEEMQSVLWIRDILVRIRGAGSGSCSF